MECNYLVKVEDKYSAVFMTSELITYLLQIFVERIETVFSI